jgi:hypothetical protein
MLAQVRMQQDRGADALVHAERAVAIADATLGAEHLHTADLLIGRADARGMTGDLAGGRADFDRVLAIRERHLGASHPEVAHALMLRAWLAISAEDAAAARADLGRARQILAEHPDPERSAMLAAMEAELP